LFEAKELEDGEINGGMEAETTLVRSEGGIELNWSIDGLSEVRAVPGLGSRG